MAKFRSWNKEYKRFAYFEDGVYYYFVARYTDGIVVRINTNNVEYKEFNWQNAEPFLTECDNDVFYFNDKVKCKCFSDFTKEDEIIGILKSNEMGIYIEDKTGKRYYYYQMSAAEEFIKLSNTHEVQNG